jgi:hypothetical protein
MDYCPSQQWLWTVAFGVLQVIPHVQNICRLCDWLTVRSNGGKSLASCSKLVVSSYR